MKYIPGKKEQYLIDIQIYHTNGGEFITEEGDDYIGYYTSRDNKFFSGNPQDTKTLSQKSYELFRFDGDDTSKKYIKIKKHYLYHDKDNPVPYLPIITEADYKRGYIYRYFVKKRNDVEGNNILEIDETQHKNMNDNKGINKDLYISKKIKWIIYGKKDDYYYKDMLATKSVSNQNKETVYKEEKNFKGLKNKLRDFREFARLVE